MVNKTPLNVPMAEINIPKVMKVAPAAPIKRLLASASGVSEAAKSGRVPMQIACTETYTRAETEMAMGKAKSKFRRGSRISPVSIKTPSKPAKGMNDNASAFEKDAPLGGAANE